MNVALLDVVLFFSAQPAQLYTEVLTSEPQLLSYTGGTHTPESVPGPFPSPPHGPEGTQYLKMAMAVVCLGAKVAYPLGHQWRRRR